LGKVEVDRALKVRRTHVYGTVARLRVKPGIEGAIERYVREAEAEVAAGDLPGFVFEHVFRLDADRDEYMLIVAFESKEAYVANASRPEQHERYLRYRELLAADPEWHDGEIVYSYPR
jgi:heme-degrading monooxygenase HmoA